MRVLKLLFIVMIMFVNLKGEAIVISSEESRKYSSFNKAKLIDKRDTLYNIEKAELEKDIWLKFDVKKREGVVVELTPYIDVNKMHFYLYDEKKREIKSRIHVLNGEHAIFTVKAPINRTYYLRIRGDIGSVDLTIYNAWFNSNIKDSNRDKFYNFYLARHLEKGNYIKEEDYNYCFRFMAKKGNEFYVKLVPHTSGKMHFYLYNEKGRTITSKLYVVNNQQAIIKTKIKKDGIYYLLVRGDEGSFDIIDVKNGVEDSKKNKSESKSLKKESNVHKVEKTKSVNKKSVVVNEQLKKGSVNLNQDKEKKQIQKNSLLPVNNIKIKTNLYSQLPPVSFMFSLRDDYDSFIFENEEFFGFTTNGKIILKNGKKLVGNKYVIIIKPFKDKEIYIFFNRNLSKNLIYNIYVYDKHNDTLNKIPGALKAFYDIDNDNIPEIITTTKDMLYAYKFIKENDTYILSILTQHPWKSDLIEIKDSSFTYPFDDPSVWVKGNKVLFYEAVFDKNNGNIILKSHIKKFKNKQEAVKWINEYFTKHTHSDFIFKLSYSRIGGDRCKKVIFKNSGIKNTDKIELLKLPTFLDEYCSCLIFKGRKFIDDSIGKRKYIDYDIRNLFLCNNSSSLKKHKKNIYISKDGKLFIGDFDISRFYWFKGKILDKEAYLIADKKYLIISNGQKSTYFLLKDLLGFNPSSVLYIDNKYLIVLHDDRPSKVYNRIPKIYEISFSLSKREKEAW